MLSEKNKMIYTVQLWLCKNMHAYWQVLLYAKIEIIMYGCALKGFFPFNKLFFNIVLKSPIQ